MPAPVTTVNPDLENERKKCTFDVEEFARWWNDGAENLQAKRESGKYISYKAIN